MLRASLDKDDYPDFTPQLKYVYRDRFTRQLIYAEKQTNIGIAGPGTIDGQGTNEAFDARANPGDRDRPYILRFANNCLDHKICLHTGSVLRPSVRAAGGPSQSC